MGFFEIASTAFTRAAFSAFLMVTKSRTGVLL
jgi:hypothetical protein